MRDSSLTLRMTLVGGRQTQSRQGKKSSEWKVKIISYTGQFFGKSLRIFLYSGSSLCCARKRLSAATISCWLILSELETIPVVSSKPTPQLLRQPRIRLKI
jgi:hypothetical protein